MKKILALILCVAVAFSIGSANKVNATEENEVVNTVSTDVVLNQFNESLLTIGNGYNDRIKESMNENSAYNDYKDYGVLYQQNTGISNIDTLYFNLIIDEKNYYNIKVGETKVLDGGYTLSVNTINNPATNKEFIKTPQDFSITMKFTLTNQSGESATFTKEVKAQVVKVVGKIINRKALFVREESIRIDNFLQLGTLIDYVLGIHKTLQVELLDGSIVDVIGFSGQGGSAGGPNGQFEAGIVNSFFDLKYILEEASSVQYMETFIKGYILDKSENIVDINGNIIVPFEERKVMEYTSNNDKIKLSAKLGAFPDSAALETTERTDLKLNNEYVAYDMNVICNNEKIQPVGDVSLFVNVPEKLKGKSIGVYYLDDKGNLKEISSIVENGVISFSTSHFSTYVLMERNEQPVVKPSAPATGDTTMPMLYLSLMAISFGFILVLKKRKELLK